MPNRPLSNDRKSPGMKVQLELDTVKIIAFEDLNIDDRTLVSAKKNQNYDKVLTEK